MLDLIREINNIFTVVFIWWSNKVFRKFFHVTISWNSRAFRWMKIQTEIFVIIDFFANTFPALPIAIHICSHWVIRVVRVVCLFLLLLNTSKSWTCKSNYKICNKRCYCKTFFTDGSLYKDQWNSYFVCLVIKGYWMSCVRDGQAWIKTKNGSGSFQAPKS